MTDEQKTIDEQTPEEAANNTSAETPVEPVEEETDNTEKASISDLNSFKGKYVALEKIKSLTQDGEFYVVLFKNGQTLRLPECLLLTMVKDKPSETKGMTLTPNQLRMMTIADEIEILLRNHYLLNVGEVDRVCQFVSTVVKNNFSLATRILWGGKGEYKISLKELNDVFVKNSDLVSELQKELNAENLQAKATQQRQ